MLKINEMFYTIQGEARYTGTPAVFIRLQGCQVGCAWCDTKHTWPVDDTQQVNISRMLEKEGDSYDWSDMTEDDIIDEVRKIAPARCHIVLTGGEPLEQNIDQLVLILKGAGYTIQIETSGTRILSQVVQDFSWVTVSPKINMSGGLKVQESAMLLANEIKMPVGKFSDVAELKELIAQYPTFSDMTKIWLQPLSQNPKSTEICVMEAKENGWNVSLQTHKYLGVR